MIDKVIRFASSYFCIDINDIYSDNRKDKLCNIKHMCWYYLHREKKVSISTISKHFSRGRWMIFYGVRKIDGWIKYDSEFKINYLEFKSKLDEHLKKD